MRRGLRPLRELAPDRPHRHEQPAARLDGAGAPRELAQLVDAFNAMLERLANGFTRLSQVSADMAHDLRTPIANLLGQTEVALGHGAAATTTRRCWRPTTRSCSAWPE